MFCIIIRSISFDLGFMDPTLQCVTDLGEVELSYCRDDSDECSLIKVFVLNGNYIIVTVTVLLLLSIIATNF